MSKQFLSKAAVRLALVVTFILLIAMGIVGYEARIEYEVNRRANSLEVEPKFTQQHLATTLHLYDLGVVDVDNDDQLDIYTVNHSARQSLLINDPNGFADQLLELGLTQNLEFPGIEPSTYLPPVEASGLYLYWNKGNLVIQAHNIDNFALVNGQIRLPQAAFVKSKANFQVSTSKSDDQLIVKFAAQGNGQLIFGTRSYYFVPEFELDEQLSLEEVYIGPRRLHPETHRFKTQPGKDRHGMAWADLNDDEQLDVFVVRGGLLGRAKQLAPNLQDELLIRQGSTFQDTAREAEVVKNGCPARQVAWVDFDGDGLLDSYIVCGRPKPPGDREPNQLHWQNQAGQFTEVAAARGVDIPGEGSFIWLDADNDGDLDLFWADGKAFWLYVNRAGRFEPQQIDAKQGKVKQITMADYDADGDLDLFVASLKGNTLLNNVNGAYQVKTLRSVGLPGKSYAANWVDYDNDGLIDLHVLPEGLYRQVPGTQTAGESSSNAAFEATHLLTSNNRKKKAEAFSSWFDADNDGDRDLLLAVKDNSQNQGDRDRDKSFIPPQWQIRLYRNQGSNNHWLQLQLQGSEHNHQAIGARVEISTPDGVQLQQVGQADGSIRSQGHYRLYFGLGQYPKVDWVKIFWPNGTVQTLENLEGDRLVQIRQDDVASEPAILAQEQFKPS